MTTPKGRNVILPNLLEYNRFCMKTRAATISRFSEPQPDVVTVCLSVDGTHLPAVNTRHYT